MIYIYIYIYEYIYIYICIYIYIYIYIYYPHFSRKSFDYLVNWNSEFTLKL